MISCQLVLTDCDIVVLFDFSTRYLNTGFDGIFDVGLVDVVLDFLVFIWDEGFVDDVDCFGSSHGNLEYPGLEFRHSKSTHCGAHGGLHSVDCILADFLLFLKLFDFICDCIGLGLVVLDGFDIVIGLDLEIVAVEFESLFKFWSELTHAFFQ